MGEAERPYLQWAENTCLVGLGSEPCLGDGLVEGVGVGEGGGDVADSDAEGRGALRKRVGGSDAVGDGDDLAAEESGGDGLVEGVGVLVVDGLGRGRVGGSRAVVVVVVIITTSSASSAGLGCGG